MIEMIAAVIGSVIALVLLFLLPVKLMKKNIVYIIGISLILALLFNLLRGLYNFQIAAAATLVLLVAATILLSRFMKNIDKEDELEDDLEDTTMSFQTENDVNDHKNSTDLVEDSPIGSMAQSKIDEYIQSLLEKKESENKQVEDETVIQATNMTEIEDDNEAVLNMDEAFENASLAEEHKDSETEHEIDISNENVIEEKTIIKEEHQLDDGWIVASEGVEETHETSHDKSFDSLLTNLKIDENNQDVQERLLEPAVEAEQLLHEIEISPNQREEMDDKIKQSDPTKYADMLFNLGDLNDDNLNSSDKEADAVTADDKQSENDKVDKEVLMKKRKEILKELDEDIF